MSIHRLSSTMVGWLLAAVGALAWSSAPAQAAVTHEYLPGISEKLSEGVPAGSGATLTGSLSGVNAMTVDAGHLFIAEHVSSVLNIATRLDRFDLATGAFEAQLAHSNDAVGEPMVYAGVAVAHAPEPVVYVGGHVDVNGSPGFVDALAEAGSLLARWTGTDTPYKSFSASAVHDVAVDNNPSNLSDWAAGDVYVADENKNTAASGEPPLAVVDVFKPEAEGKEKYVTQLTGTVSGGGPEVPFSEPIGVAVDPRNGHVIVADAGKHAVDVFEPVSGVEGTYKLLFTLTGPTGSQFGHLGGVTVDDKNGDIYAWAENSVYQFTAEGGYLGRITETSGGPFGGSVDSVAVDPESEDVYVGYNGQNSHGEFVGLVAAYGPNIVIPDVASAPPSGVRPDEATLNGSVDPDAAGPATCQFVWGTSTSFGKVAPCPGPVAEGSSPVPVEVTLSGLQPDTTYYYRLQATNQANGHTNFGEASQDQTFTTPGPGIEESASDVAATSATLDAAVNPHGASTFVYFQYGTSAAYGEQIPASPGVFMGSGEGGVEIGRHVQGLQADVVYHYRVVALSETEPGAHPGVYETFYGPDQTFTTQGTSKFALPDGRQWEMVSPPDKHGALIYGVTEVDEGAETQAAAGGGAISYVASAATELEPAGYTNNMQVLSTRGADGWESRDMAPPHGLATSLSVGNGQEYRLFSEDLSLAVVQPFGAFEASLSAEASEQTAFLHSDYQAGEAGVPCASSCYRPLVTGAAGYANVPPGTVFGGSGFVERGHELACPPVTICGPLFVGGTPDLSHVVLRSNVPLTATAGASDLYEWSAGKLALVSVLPDGTPTSGELGSNSEEYSMHPISDDGSRVIWAHGSHLYMRDVSRSETIELDAVQGGTGSGSPAPVYRTASGDGSRVFFTDSQLLTADAGSGSDLYECAIVEEAGRPHCDLSDLTPRAGGEDGDVQGVLGASEDGSWVYFVADEKLAPGAVAGTCASYGAPTSTCNLYARHDGVTRLVAVLSQEDQSDWGGGGGVLVDMTARVSPNGEWLAFMSQRELTGYVTRDALTGRPDEEVYLYGAGTGSVVCASCDPTGARPVAVASGGGLGSSARAAASIPAWTPYRISKSLHQSRYLSDSGRLFFDSSDALVPQDVNGTQDVYEYEPPAVGDCQAASATFSERAEGCIALISAGTSAQESAFLEASESGADVFFLTTSRLSSLDFDSSYDVYDAHQCTAAAPCFPASPAQPPPCETGDACKPAPTPQPTIYGSPSSATFSGAGNITPTAPAATVTRRSATRAQKLAKALKACAKRPRRRRAACRRQARKRYATQASRKVNTRRGGAK